MAQASRLQVLPFYIPKAWPTCSIRTDANLCQTSLHNCPPILICTRPEALMAAKQLQQRGLTAECVEHDSITPNAETVMPGLAGLLLPGASGAAAGATFGIVTCSHRLHTPRSLLQVCNKNSASAVSGTTVTGHLFRACANLAASWCLHYGQRVQQRNKPMSGNTVSYNLGVTCLRVLLVTEGCWRFKPSRLHC